MIVANFSKDEGKIVLEVTGHSESARSGEDIICAGASTLVHTVAQEMRFMYEDRELQKEPIIKLENGDGYVEVEPLPSSFDTALHAFYVIQVGFYLLAHNFPKYVQLIPFGKADKA